jgi:hypothetical protein
VSLSMSKFLFFVHCLFAGVAVVRAQGAKLATSSQTIVIEIHPD